MKAFLTEHLGFKFCQEQPRIARTPEAIIMIHVDEILFVGLKSFWNDVFVKKMKERFSVSHDELKGVGSSITFLRRKITEVEHGLVLAPGTTVERVVGTFESACGKGSCRSCQVTQGCSCQTLHRNFQVAMQVLSDQLLGFVFTWAQTSCTQSRSWLHV